MVEQLAWVRYPLDILPGGITCDFGEYYAGRNHRGTDVGVIRGTPVFAPQAGTVVKFTNDGSFGNAVCLMHPGTGWLSLYAHLDKAEVYVGQEVLAGQRIGLSGNTGWSTGPHLHWQVSTSPSFPVDIRYSRDPMAVPFVDQEEEEMSPEERELLILVASVVGGWSTGQTFEDAAEALPSFRTFEEQGQRILIGLGLTQASLDSAIKALAAHIEAGGHDDTAPVALAALEDANAQLTAIQERAINYPEPGGLADPDDGG